LSNFWQNRIVRYGEEAPDQLLANENNPRIHPKMQQQALEGSLEEIGWIQDVIVNLRTSEEWGPDRGVETMIDGHLRVKLALRHEQSSVPVKYVDLSPAQERLALATLDPITGYAAIDNEIMSGLLDGVEIENPDLSDFLDTLAEDLGFDWDDGQEVPEDPGPQIDRAAELQEKWQVERGQIWQVGRHRLMCGDATSAEDVGRLMEGKVADLALTDPPYGIKRDKGFEGFEGFGGFGPPIARRQYDDDWDSERPPLEAFEALAKNAQHLIVFGGNFFTDMLPQSNHWLVWDKQNTMPTFGDCELAWTNISRNSVKKYEVVYNGLIGKEGERSHPTQKPVSLFAAIIDDYSEADALVLDLFCGSGTTLVACEQTGRIGFGMDIEPKYCSVALERLTEMGLDAKLVGD